MKHSNVKSSMIESVGYDMITQNLEVKFKNGEVYNYENVKPHIHSMFMNAKSMGSFLANTLARNHKYKKKSPGQLKD